MRDDPFSDVLKLADTRSILSGAFIAAAPWAFSFAPGKLKFFAVVKGHCWLVVSDGEAASVRIEAGDVFLVSHRSFVLADDPATAAIDATSAFAGHGGKTMKFGDAEDAFLLGGHVQLDPVSGQLLTDVLPPLIHARAASPQAGALQWILDQLVHERRSGLPGAAIASAQLAQLMFVQLLRTYLAGSGFLPAGMLRAASDPKIAPALRLIHADPSRGWRLGELARAAAMSRTSFAVYFKSVAGIAPLAYLAMWRMRLAERALREANTPVSVLARSLGYTSESAFSNAFKRVIGKSPKLYRDAVKANGLADEGTTYGIAARNAKPTRAKLPAR